jgi:hypothetical protein
LAGTSKLDDATLTLLQDYAAAAAARLGLQVAVSTSSGKGDVEVQIIRQWGGEELSFSYAHPYSFQVDAARFIDRMLGRVSRDP